MSDVERKNALIKRAYMRHLEHVRGFGVKSRDQVMCSIGHLEDYLDGDFCKFNSNIAIAFKAFLFDEVSKKTGNPLTTSMISKTCRNNTKFLVWLSEQAEFEPQFSAGDAAYLSPTADMKAAVRRRPVSSTPDIGDFVKAIMAMPHETLFERRGRAAMAMLALTGARADALASFRFGSVKLQKRQVDQDGIAVRTKDRKRIKTWFFPVGECLLLVIEDWLKTLKELGYVATDPLFPADERVAGPDGLLVSIGLSKTVWESCTPVRKIFKKLCEDNEMGCNHPHAIRRSLVKLAFRTLSKLEDLKAWSQNLGHSNIATTVLVYGELDALRQEEIMCELWANRLRQGGGGLVAPPTHLAPVISMLQQLGYQITRPPSA
jgi:site-specific recombinase XerC